MVAFNSSHLIESSGISKAEIHSFHKLRFIDSISLNYLDCKVSRFRLSFFNRKLLVLLIFRSVKGQQSNRLILEGNLQAVVMPKPDERLKWTTQ